MGLFDKKYCDICGEKIGLLGNRKLENGNLCKDCAKQLSPFFSERRRSTVEEIREQLEYRKENQQSLADFSPGRVFGRRTKVMVDENSRQFIVTGSQNWAESNPDLIGLDRVTYCNLTIDEDKDEIYQKGPDGKRVSYQPPRYEYEYAFWIEIGVNSPWFEQIRFELSADRPKNRFDPQYKQYEQEANELRTYLLARGNIIAAAPPQQQQQQYQQQPQQYQQPQQQQQQYQQPQYQQPQQPPQQPQPAANFCGNCGSRLSGGPTRFCPNCGAPLTTG
jgi:DNA segregation ATPase FtsK/SpoIIIE-like protein